MESHGLPPPPVIHHGPCQVFAASCSSLDSNPSAGSPGTVNVRQTSFPVSASYAETQPRTPNSDPAFPFTTRSLAMRVVPVLEYDWDWSMVTTSQTGLAVVASTALSR